MQRLYPQRPFVGVGVVVLKEDEMILVKRGNEPGKGKWSIPGGLVELGESLEQTVKREAEEETGMIVENLRLLDAVDNVVLDEEGRVKYHFVIVDYLVRPKAGTARAGSDAEELKWVKLDDVEKHQLTDTFRRFFSRNREKLREQASCP